MRGIWLAALLAPLLIAAPPPIMPLKDIRPGMQGTGRTIFAGTKIEEFQVTVLGVLENVGPKQSIILARLSGGPLDKTGVLQGMSGSPVFFGDKLAGAVALAFPYAKEPIAGIRPIEDMLRLGEVLVTNPNLLRAKLNAPLDVTAGFPQPWSIEAGGMRMVEIATPLAFSGFTQATLDHFAPRLRAMGLEPRQGVGGGGHSAAPQSGAARLEPGAMITAMLLAGDMSIGADGTVTHIDGDRVYAFGHRLIGAGDTQIPFARAEVLALLPALSTSFKISTPREWLGSITEDRSAGISGRLGPRPRLVPVSITVEPQGAGERNQVRRTRYQLEMVNDRYLSPLLLQIALFSALDATERTAGAGSFSVTGSIEFTNGVAPIRLDNVFTGEVNVPEKVSTAAAVPLAYALQSGFPGLALKNVDLKISSWDKKKEYAIDGLWSSRRQVRPGETIRITTILAADNGREVSRSVEFNIPVGATPGTLYITAADGELANYADYRFFLQTPPRSPSQVVSFLNSLRTNNKVYIRIWRAEPSFYVEGREMPSPPPSLSLLLEGTLSTGGAVQQYRSNLEELEIDAGDFVVRGQKSIQVQVVE